MGYQIDQIPITAFICRQLAAAAFERKFIASCGNKVIVKLTESIKIISILPEYPESHKCSDCLEKIKFVKTLIESGKWKP